MNYIKIDASNTYDALEQISEQLNGEISERWGECVLKIDNNKATGCIVYINFDWGVNLVKYSLAFKDSTTFKIDTSVYNPIFFFYLLRGEFSYYFEDGNKSIKIDKFQSAIASGKDNGFIHFVFPKNIELEINALHIRRTKFLKKRHMKLLKINEKIYDIFHDTDHEEKFSFYSSLNLKIADEVNELNNIKEHGMVKILQIESKVYKILSLHIKQYDNNIHEEDIPSNLMNSELEKIRSLSVEIVKNPSKNYTLKMLSRDTGLSQAKLQSGFKFLYTRTVAEFIKHARLEIARDLMNNSEYNISQIVYAIGFTSRSYFSKIFKEKYDISPNDYKKNL